MGINEISSIKIGYGKYAKRKWIDLIESCVLPADIKTNTYVVVKAEGRIIKDPNKKFVLPIEFFYKILSKPEDKKSKEEFKKFTQLTPQLRNKYISEFFQLLEKKGISKSKTTFRSFPVSFANTGVGSNIVQDYGKAPPLQDFGVESWGNLRKIDIFFFNAYRLKQKVEDFSKILKQQLEIVQQKTFQRLKQKIDRIEINLHPITDNKFIRTGMIDQLDSSCCPIIFLGQKIHNYREIKSRLTQERGIPVQGIKEATLYNTRNITGLVRTIIPQIIAKTGGFPYKLHPPILDNAIIIGLDKARDSSLRRPSASAGVAAVTPEGQYISGTSTPLENNTTDFIDVDKLAPNLLLELDENKFNKEYEYVVILRDGSPNICRQEVPLWKKHLEEYGKNFIFLACRKTHPYRVFPKDILEQQNKRRVDYSIPAVLNSEPILKAEFLFIQAFLNHEYVVNSIIKNESNKTILNKEDLFKFHGFYPYGGKTRYHIEISERAYKYCKENNIKLLVKRSLEILKVARVKYREITNLLNQLRALTMNHYFKEYSETFQVKTLKIKLDYTTFPNDNISWFVIDTLLSKISDNLSEKHEKIQIEILLYSSEVFDELIMEIKKNKNFIRYKPFLEFYYGVKLSFDKFPHEKKLNMEADIYLNLKKDFMFEEKLDSITEVVFLMLESNRDELTIKFNLEEKPPLDHYFKEQFPIFFHNNYFSIEKVNTSSKNKVLLKIRKKDNQK